MQHHRGTRNRVVETRLCPARLRLPLGASGKKFCRADDESIQSCSWSNNCAPTPSVIIPCPPPSTTASTTTKSLYPFPSSTAAAAVSPLVAVGTGMASTAATAAVRLLRWQDQQQHHHHHQWIFSTTTTTASLFEMSHIKSHAVFVFASSFFRCYCSLTSCVLFLFCIFNSNNNNSNMPVQQRPCQQETPWQ